MLETEREFFDKIHSQLLADHPGKFVLIKGGDLIGTFATIEEAVTEGARRFGLEPFLVRQVLQAAENDVNIPALELGILSANTTRPV